MELSRQEHWSGLPLPTPGDLSYPGTKLTSSALHADSLPSESQHLPLITLLASINDLLVAHC